MTPNEEKEQEALLLQNEIEEDFNAWFAQAGMNSDGDDLLCRESAFRGYQAGRAALRAESEPVAWINPYTQELMADDQIDPMWKHTLFNPLYTAPQTEPKDTGSEI